jgi:hypothetical protein
MSESTKRSVFDSNDFSESNSDELIRLLDSKMRYEMKIEEKLNVEYLMGELNNKLEFIKEEIEIRIESLISKLNEYKDDLFKQIESTKEYVLNELLINDKINEIKNKYKCEDDVTINDYSKYELKLKQFENEINKLNSHLS